MQSSPEPVCEEPNACTETNHSSSVATLEEYPEAEFIESLFLEGKTAMLHLNYAEASQKFGEASEILAKYYGTSSMQCADGLFLCGQALFASSIQRNNLVKSTLVYKTSPKNLKNLESEMQILEDSELGFDSDEAEIVSEFRDEQTNGFDNAWHNLDLAREIYQRANTVDSQLKLSEVRMVLGDIAMELENYDLALSHFTESLSLKQLFLKPDNRTLAEAHLKVASAYEHISNLSQAIEHLEQVQAILIRRIQNMKGELEIIDRAIGKGKAKAPPEHEDPYVLVEREITEVISSIREVSLKIDDLRSLETNGALCLELALGDTELLPNSPDLSASLEVDDFQDPIDFEMQENEKRRLLIEDSELPRSPKKKTKI